jgi:hypothetical protein
VDYLGLVLAAHEQQTLGEIAFRDLPGAAVAPPDPPAPSAEPEVQP